MNYLDDYLFAALIRALCNHQVQQFLDICATIHFPVNLDKTFWASTQTVFLGFLLDTIAQRIFVPHEKIAKGVNMIQSILNSKNRKVTVVQLQKACGFLNFLRQAIIPGRAFTRRIYMAINPALKPYHHVRLNKEVILDLSMWLQFLRHPACYSRAFTDITNSAMEVEFYSDASKNPGLGMGAYCQKSWMVQQWDREFLLLKDPSIDYLELYALTAAVLAWLRRFKNQCICILCDNQSVVAMVNNTSSSCKN